MPSSKGGVDPWLKSIGLGVVLGALPVRVGESGVLGSFFSVEGGKTRSLDGLRRKAVELAQFVVGNMNIEVAAVRGPHGRVGCGIANLTTTGWVVKRAVTRNAGSGQGRSAASLHVSRSEFGNGPSRADAAQSALDPWDQLRVGEDRHRMLCLCCVSVSVRVSVM